MMPLSSCAQKTEKRTLSLQDYLKVSKEEWFLTGKKKYTIQAMMVSEKLSFRNELELTDYTVEDDGETVVLKGTANEMWATKLNKVISTYTRPDGSPLTEDDFAVKDQYIDITTIPSPDSNYAMFVPKDISVTVMTSWGDELHTNLSETDHGRGDYLVCAKTTDGEPDLNDVWVLNGVLFPQNYDTSRHKEVLSFSRILMYICTAFYGLLCVFSIVTGLMYAIGKRELNPLELSDSFMTKYEDPQKLNKFAVSMGWVTFVVGIMQGITSFCFLDGNGIIEYVIAFSFTLFSITSVAYKLKGKISTFAILKSIAYVAILIILLLPSVREYFLYR